MDLNLTPTADVPEFDWNADIPADLIVNIARFGDDDMRRLVASHRSITDEAGLALLVLGDRGLGELLRRNIETSPRLFALAAKPRKAAAAATRAAKKQAKKDRVDYLAFLNTIQAVDQK